MATYYWVGGSGNWDATSTANWSNASGGASGFGPPTLADNVIFDAGSNVGTDPFAVTVTGTSSVPATCADFSTGGAGGALDGAMTLTMGATAQLDCYGSMTWPVSNFSLSGTSGATIKFSATTTGKTFTSNGVVPTNLRLEFNGAGGEWALGSALTITSIRVLAGTFNTNNYNISGNAAISSTGNSTRAINLGSSTITSSSSIPITFSGSNLTLNAGTSTITCSSGSPTFAGGGFTFYDVTFSGTGFGTTTITGTNVFNSLNQASRAATGSLRFVIIGGNQTVNGTLTLGTTNTAIRRIVVTSDIIGAQRTITLNGTLTALADVDFRDIKAAGTVARPWTGTRLGNCLGNSDITFDAPKTVYWNLAGSQNWSATGWATTNNGSPAVNNFPLAQDIATFTEAGAAGTVTINGSWQIGSIQMADGISNRTTAFTFATGTQNPIIYGNVTLFSGLTLTGTGLLTFAGQGTTQQITSATILFTQAITINSPNGIIDCQDALTQSSTSAFTLANGTLKLKSSATSTVGAFATSGTNQKFLQSTTPGAQATLSQASGTVTAQNLTIRDINAIGGATWNAFVDQGNIDAGNNDGWNFEISPIIGGNEYTYQLRSFTQPRRF
jgi:hypothetical protein